MLVDLLPFIVFVAFFFAFRSGYYFACWWIYYTSLLLFWLQVNVDPDLNAAFYVMVLHGSS
jgi:hypothetical protein